MSKFCDDGNGAIDSLQKQIHYTYFFIIPQNVKPGGILATGTVLKVNEEFKKSEILEIFTFMENMIFIYS